MLGFWYEMEIAQANLAAENQHLPPRRFLVVQGINPILGPGYGNISPVAESLGLLVTRLGGGSKMAQEGFGGVNIYYSISEIGFIARDDGANPRAVCSLFLDRILKVG